MEEQLVESGLWGEIGNQDQGKKTQKTQKAMLNFLF